MLIYSMSVSVDGFIADREGAFGWTAPSEEQFRFNIALARELGGHLCGTARTSQSRPKGQSHAGSGFRAVASLTATGSSKPSPRR